MIIVILIALAVFAIDFFTKKKVTDLNREGRLPESVLGGAFRLKRVENPGMVMGLGKKHPLLVKILPGFVLLLYLLLSWKHLVKSGPLCKIGWGMLIGGSAGNVADHVRTGKVVDFIQLRGIRGKKKERIYYNLADVGVLIGAILSLFR